MKVRGLFGVVATLSGVGCALSALDGLSGGATPSDGGADGGVAQDASEVGRPSDAGSDVVDAELDLALTGGCQSMIACERVVFVTHDTFVVSDIGSLAGADTLCNRAANGSSAVARVRGRSFRAWLSTSFAGAAARLVHGTVGYVRTDGQTIATDWSIFASGRLLLNFDVDETGHDLPAPDIAWTGTNANGTAAATTCGDWTSSSASDDGLVGFTDWQASADASATWSAGNPTPCDRRAHLYCIEE